jgi:hypothetical protein
MEDKLELKHLAPYLPYDVEVELKNEIVHNQIILDVDSLRRNGLSYIKPILRPLSDLTKEIDWRNDGKKILFEKLFFRENSLKLNKELRITNGKPISEFLTYGIVEKMLEHHFDVFGLIEKGLAIPMGEEENDFNQELDDEMGLREMNETTNKMFNPDED